MTLATVPPEVETDLGMGPPRPIVIISEFGKDSDETVYNVSVVPALDSEEGKSIYSKAVEKFARAGSQLSEIGSEFDSFQQTSFDMGERVVTVVKISS